MTSWSFLYDEMYGSSDEEMYFFNNDGRPLADDRPISDDYINFSDTLNINMPISSMSEDRIDLNLDQLANNGFWKYEEDLTMKEVRDYLSSTYQAHYTSKDSKTQTLDLIESIGDAEPFCRSNAIKYLSRFGKKGGKSKQDILKAIHYCILLYHFSGLHKQPKGDYETF
ncbi:nucleotide kinase [Synechococcus phage S-SCSM1]|uniref:DUF3310 domain-containing protein n=1 Tax=Synechococcus phage S-SCSM1 TaxID=2588487 RepID=A0A6M2ZIG9_9CAUD|nr:nucleotide kinase [Synechococcus phage S-SCSM1]QFG06316.2 hypothetical protein SSCSM1_59 [Synechococcus phage S-SCSM1]